MILITRTPAPKIFFSHEVNRLRNEAITFHRNNIKSQRKSKNSNYVMRDSEVIFQLNEMFYSKCAYCEQKIFLDNARVDHFRPLNGALGLTALEFSSEHYWWLAYEWDNFYYACNSCNQAKGNRFPVKGSRCGIMETGKNLKNEQALLLDPCGNNDPFNHLYFDEKGHVRGLSMIGKVTIEVLGLNRTSLIKQRFEQIKILHQLAMDVYSATETSETEIIDQLSGRSEEFSLMKKQLLIHWFTDPDQFLIPEYNLGSGLQLQYFTIPSVTKIQIPFFYKIPPLPKLSLPSIKVLPTESLETNAEIEFTPDIESIRFISSTLIEKVEIKNFKAIDSLSFEFKSNDFDKASWKMFLGENGVSKTSVLQAISLALVGQEEINGLNLDPIKFLKDRSAKNVSLIKIEMSGGMKPIELVITNNGFKSSIQSSLLQVFGYGATRLMDDENEEYGMKDCYIKNLFDPNERIKGVNSWLLSLTADNFDQVAIALKEILALDDKGLFVRKKKKIFFSANSVVSPIPLDSLSDGYQSLIALSVNIMKNLLRRWPSLEVAEGIILIDEIGVHMHPRWKMRIVNSFREAFPRVQFICTTHEPLCLRGLSSTEVELIKKDSDAKVRIVTDLPPIEGMRIDQILLSEHFGLNSTLDPQLEEYHDEYYRLLKKQNLSKDETTKVVELKKIIDQNSVIGFTRREQMLLKYIDEFLALNDFNQDQSVKLRDSTKKKVMHALMGNLSND